MTRIGAIVLALLVVAGSAWAQQRPLVTEDPETVGAGRILLEGGLDYARDVTYPASGLTGNLLRFPAVGASVGVSSIAEVQIDGGFWNELTITDRRVAPLSGLVPATGETTSTVDDLVLATKVRLVPEGAGRPAMGIRFGTRLPVASQESGLGLGTTDFFASLLLAKTVQSVRIVGNGGIGVLSDPTRPASHDNVLLYGLSFARALSNAAEVVGEVNGLVNSREGATPSGTGTRGTFRFGARYTRGMVRVDGGMLVGLTSRDPAFGVTAGITYVFSAFQVP